MLNRPLSILLAVTLAAMLGVPSLAHAARPGSGKAIKPAVIYHNYCSVCHGDKGDGRSRARHSLNPPPMDFTSAEAAHELTRKKMIDVVTDGEEKTAMVGWKAQLSPQEIEAVVDYIRRAFMQAAADPVADRGRTIFARTCTVCHGDKGNGQTWAAANMSKPPRDFTSAETRADLSRDKMIFAVTNGKSDTAMPGFSRQLPRKDIEAVVDYILSSFMQAPAGTAGISGTYAHGMPSAPAEKPAAKKKHDDHHVNVNMRAAMPKRLVGDPAKGEKFYKDNCALCHGDNGDGRGKRAYFINPKPRNFLHAATRAELNRPELFEHIDEGVLGTDMPAWGKVLTDQQIADVAEYVYRKFIMASDSPAAAKGK